MDTATEETSATQLHQTYRISRFDHYEIPLTMALHAVLSLPVAVAGSLSLSTSHVLVAVMKPKVLKTKISHADPPTLSLLLTVTLQVDVRELTCFVAGVHLNRFSIPKDELSGLGPSHIPG